MTNSYDLNVLKSINNKFCFIICELESYLTNEEDAFANYTKNQFLIELFYESTKNTHILSIIIEDLEKKDNK